MEINDLSPSMQDYLETIFEIGDSDRPVRITDIANKLKIAKASVFQTISRLKEAGLIRQQIYGPVELTDRGRELAVKISLRHRKLSKFLAEVLKVDQETADKDACLMEHAVSSQTMDKLTDFLCRNGYMTQECNFNEEAGSSTARSMEALAEASIVRLALSELKEGQRGRVVKVATKGAIRRRIMEMGVITGTEIVVKGFAPLGDPMELGIKGYNLSMRKAEAADIIVELF